MKRARPDEIAVRSRLVSLIDRFAGIRVAVFGDLLVDEFIYGQISRVSREAPVLILEYDSTEIVPGGAGTQPRSFAVVQHRGQMDRRGGRRRRRWTRDPRAHRLRAID